LSHSRDPKLPSSKPPAARAHLVERAFEALGGVGAMAAKSPVLERPPLPSATGALTADASIDVAPHNPAAEVSAPGDTVPPVVGLRTIALDTLRRAGLVVTPPGVARTRLSEELSIVQQQVVRATKTAPDDRERGRNVVLVTSPSPGDGKSFSALNIAADIARSGSGPVILVDADSKKGNLSDLLGVSDLPGIRVLTHEPSRRPEGLVVPTSQRSFSVVPFGLASPNSSSFPAAAMLAAAVLRLARALPAHILIVDVPPCLASSEPSSIAAIAGQVIMVVAAEVTQRGQLEAALDNVEACPTLQLLLNRTRQGSDGFGIYGTYYG